MKKLFISFMFFINCPVLAGDCGRGYVLVDHVKVDGLPTKECQKLWCRDLELGRAMGSGDKAANGYVMTDVPVELCDVSGNCIDCFGDRKWCSGVPLGVWNPEFGVYTRGGADSITYTSVQKGGCFNWQMEKPVCAEGEDAILQQGEWVCATPKSSIGDIARSPAVRRTGTRLRGTLRR